MAASNLVVKLLLDSGAFDTNIKSAKAQIQGLEKVGKNIVGTLGKFAGALGIVTTASAAFEKIIRGSQTTSDAFDRAIRAGKTSVDSFFTAISTGDFTAFNLGLDNIIKKAKDAASAIDQLGNTTMSYNYFNAKNQADYALAMQKAKDKTLSKEEREAAQQTATAILGKQQEITNVMVATVENSIASLITETNGLSAKDVSILDLDRILMLDVSAKGAESKKQLEAQYKEYEAIYNKMVAKYTTTTAHQTQFGVQYQSTVDYDAVKKAMHIYNIHYKDAVLYNEILVKKGDAWLQNLIDIANQAESAKRTYASMAQQMNKVKTMDMSKGVTSTSSTKKVDPAVEGSLRFINEEIDKVQKELENLNPELNPQKLQELNTKLSELENKKRKIEFEITYADEIAKFDPTKPIGAGQSIQMGGFNKLTPPKGLGTTNVENVNNTADTTNKITANEKWATSINGVASALGAVTNMTNEGASAWISWGAGILTSIAAALPALSTLFAAETAVAGATAAKSAAETPVVGWILAGAAVASVLAAVAALPKFANGGIIDSPFGVGDRVLARVNGGEMILNKRQQSNLFNLLDNGGMAGANNKVTFEIEGKKLIGVLKNYNNKISKAL